MNEFELLHCRYCYHIDELNTYELQLYRSLFKEDVPTKVLLPQFGEEYHPLNNLLGSSYLFITTWVWIVGDNSYDIVDITNSRDDGIIGIDNNILCRHNKGILGPVSDLRFNTIYFEKLRALSSSLDDFWSIPKGKQIKDLITKTREAHLNKMDTWNPIYKHEFLTSSINHPYHVKLQKKFSLTNKDNYRMIVWHHDGALYTLCYIKKDNHKYVYLNDFGNYIPLLHNWYIKTQHPINTTLKNRIPTLQFLCA